jgi:hypothetical protein
MKLMFSGAAVRGLVRLREFVTPNNPDAPIQVAAKLRGSIQNLIDSVGF